MTETNPTPAEAIPFALVDDTGHLTGKPAEGVEAMIQAATEELKAKLTEASKAGIDEAAVEKIITDHEADILKAWQADPTYSKAISGITQQAFAGKNNESRPSDLWLYLISAAAAGASRKTWDPLGLAFIMIANSDSPLAGDGDFLALVDKHLPQGWSLNGGDNSELEQNPDIQEQAQAGAPYAIYSAVAAHLLIQNAVKLTGIKSIGMGAGGLAVSDWKGSTWYFSPNVAEHEPEIEENED